MGGALELAGLTSVSDMPSFSLSSAGMEAWVIVALHWETWLSAVHWYRTCYKMSVTAYGWSVRLS